MANSIAKPDLRLVIDARLVDLLKVLDGAIADVDSHPQGRTQASAFRRWLVATRQHAHSDRHAIAVSLVADDLSPGAHAERVLIGTSARVQGRYRVRFVKPASVSAPEFSRVEHVKVGAIWFLIWRPSRDPGGQGCYEHYEHEPIMPEDHSPRAEEVREQIRTHFEDNRHPGSWWQDYDIDASLIFSECQVEVLEGPLP